MVTPAPAPRVEVARPGTYATAAECAARWLRPRPIAPEPAEEPPQRSPGLKARAFDAVERLTWRATNVSGSSIRWTADAVRTFFDRRKR
jgi:hypothetical protein